MKHRIEFINEQNILPVNGKLKLMLSSAITKALARFSCPPAAVTVTFVDNAQIQKINREQRNIDKETDVLSFPLLDAHEGILPMISIADTDDGFIALGDIVLSAEKAYAQAMEYGHSVAREFAFLTVHSTLHLLGFDHMETDEQKKMRAMEEEVLSSMGLTRKD